MGSGRTRFAPSAASGLGRSLRPDAVLGRGGRVAVFAASGLGLAVGAHRLAGGSVAPGTTWLALVALVILGALVTGRERSGRFIGSTVLLSQLASHLLFVLPALVALARHRTGQLSTATLELLLLCHHGRHPVSGATLRQAASGLDLHDLSRSAGAASADVVRLGSVLASAAPMLAAHLAAAAMLAWWLRRGERLVWSAASRVVVTVTSLVRGLPVAPATPQVLLSPVPIRVVRLVQWSLPLSRRGPPACSGTVYLSS